MYYLKIRILRYEVSICKRGGLLCSHCKTEILNGQQISQCQECRVSTHVTCSHELQPDCTLYKKEEKEITPAFNDEKIKSNIESWVTIWE